MPVPILRLGLCCMLEMECHRKPKRERVYCSRSVSLKHYTREKGAQLALLNCKDLKRILVWNEEVAPTLPDFQGIPIRLMRISSDIWPRFSDAKIADRLYDVEGGDIEEALKEVGEYARKHGHRLLMHPGQFNQVGTPTPSVFESTCRELAYQARVLDMIGIDADQGVLIVHGGGTYKDKAATKKRWIRQFRELPESVQARLVVENDERQYSVEDVLEICKAIGRPMIYDSHHHRCYQLNHPDYVPSFEMTDIVDTWPAHVRPIMHVSEQREGARVGAHSDYIREGVPPEILALCQKGVGVDLEIEAKKKELAIGLLLKTHAKPTDVTRSLFTIAANTSSTSCNEQMDASCNEQMDASYNERKRSADDILQSDQKHIKHAKIVCDTIVQVCIEV